MAGGHIKPLFEEKSPSESSCQKNLVLKEKICKLHVTFVTYIVVCLVKNVSACGEGTFEFIELFSV